MLWGLFCRCWNELRTLPDEAHHTKRQHEAIAAYTAILEQQQRIRQQHIEHLREIKKFQTEDYIRESEQRKIRPDEGGTPPWESLPKHKEVLSPKHKGSH